MRTRGHGEHRQCCSYEPGLARVAGSCQKLGEARQDPSGRLRRERGPADTLFPTSGRRAVSSLRGVQPPSFGLNSRWQPGETRAGRVRHAGCPVTVTAAVHLTAGRWRVAQDGGQLGDPRRAEGSHQESHTSPLAARALQWGKVRVTDGFCWMRAEGNVRASLGVSWGQDFGENS